MLERRHSLIDTLGGDSILIDMQIRGLDLPAIGFEVHRFSSYDTTFSDSRELNTVIVAHGEPHISAYQEFWHSWRTFHPNTTRYQPK